MQITSINRIYKYRYHYKSGDVLECKLSNYDCLTDRFCYKTTTKVVNFTPNCRFNSSSSSVSSSTDIRLTFESWDCVLMLWTPAKSYIAIDM